MIKCNFNSKYSHNTLLAGSGFDRVTRATSSDAVHGDYSHLIQSESYQPADVILHVSDVTDLPESLRDAAAEFAVVAESFRPILHDEGRDGFL